MLLASGECGSCYAFGVTATLENLWTIKTSQKPILSPQQGQFDSELLNAIHLSTLADSSLVFIRLFLCVSVMDCVKPAAGCDGGSPTKAFQWYTDNGGAILDIKYPYLTKVSWTVGQLKWQSSKSSPLFFRARSPFHVTCAFVFSS